jgi:hypothetical protein
MRAKEEEMTSKKARGIWGHAVYNKAGEFLYWSHEYDGPARRFRTEVAATSAIGDHHPDIVIRAEVLPQFMVR